MPIVRSLSFLEKHRKMRDTETIVSTPADRRGEVKEEVILPGYVAERKSASLDIDPLLSGKIHNASDNTIDFYSTYDTRAMRFLFFVRG